MESEKRYLSPNVFCSKYGVPVTMVRREIRMGLVPGFYSGSWFHVDVPTYLAVLSRRGNNADKE